MSNRFRFRTTTRSALWYLALVVVLPVSSLSILGMIYLWQHNQLLSMLVSWLGITLAGYSLFVFWPQKRRNTRNQRSARELLDGSDPDPLSTGPATDDLTAASEQLEDKALPEHLYENPDWTDQDRLIWQTACVDIERIVQSRPAWETLPELALQQLSRISAGYHGDEGYAEYRFTLPEALLVISVASGRYRSVVLSHLPFAERVSVASLVYLYEKQTHIQSGLTWFNRIRRTLRLTNPVAAAIGELRDQFTNRVFDQLSDNLQSDMKRLLLQEVAQVGIDLYSGRLKSSTEELNDYRSRAFIEDSARTATPLEPLRVVILGQISAGKSSLVNALIKTLSAETDLLPTTDRSTVHALSVPDASPIHLIDTAGIDGSEPRNLQLLKMAAQADLIVHVAKANQPARAPDYQLQQLLGKHFEAQPNRRIPPVILVLSHVDQLSPRQQWSPPYDLSSKQAKSQSISEALISARDQLRLAVDTPAIPVCLSENRGHYNVEAVAAQIMMLSDAAALTQMNRLRIERTESGPGWRERWEQFRRLGLTLGRSATATGQNKQESGER